jgi:hypothetical protein
MSVAPNTTSMTITGYLRRAANDPAATTMSAIVPASNDRRAGCACEAKYVVTVMKAANPAARAPSTTRLHRGAGPDGEIASVDVALTNGA